MGVGKGVPKNSKGAGARTFELGSVARHLEMFLYPKSVTVLNLVVLGQRVSVYVGGSKNLGAQWCRSLGLGAWLSDATG